MQHIQNGLLFLAMFPHETPMYADFETNASRQNNANPFFRPWNYTFFCEKQPIFKVGRWIQSWAHFSII